MIHPYCQRIAFPVALSLLDSAAVFAQQAASSREIKGESNFHSNTLLGYPTETATSQEPATTRQVELVNTTSGRIHPLVSRYQRRAVVVQREMENKHSPLASVPLLWAAQFG